MSRNRAYRGFDTTFSFDLSEALDDDVNLVGKTALFTVKADRKAVDNTAALRKDFIISADDLDADNTKLLIIAFSAEEMLDITEGTYYKDLKLFNADETGLLYVPYEKLKVVDDVTDRIVIS